jgi:hypothetical protein
MRKSLLMVLPALALLASCGIGNGRKVLNRRISLSRHDDIPYGARVAYELLPHIFPEANISVNSNASPASFTNSGTPGSTYTSANRVLIIIGTSVMADASDVNALMSFIQEGNHVFISANRISENLLKELSIRATGYQPRTPEPDSLTVGVYSPVNTSYKTFSYPGDSYDRWITKLDTQFVSILGRDVQGHPNFVRLTYKGGGTLYLHLAPLAFSNFFLLHKQNMAYYENALSYLPRETATVIWDEYFRYDHGREFSALQYILGNAALRWAFWLLLLLFAVIYIFDSKRRQRLVPVMGALNNTSLDFVRTIGRLYYQRRDNHNLAMKMVTHFQGIVKTRFHLPVTVLDETFVDRLANRTGYPKQSLTSLVGYMQLLPAKAYIPDGELLDFHKQLEAFYKHT